MKCSSFWAIIVLVSIPLVFSSEISCNIGDCCRHGKVLSSETLCRPARNECDAAEHCTGTSGSCPLDISIKNGTHCGTKENPGKCLDGSCMTEAIKAKLGMCIATCSKDHGECSKSGDCVCHDGWISPPLCDKNKTDRTETKQDTKMLNSIIMKRHRRATGHVHHHHHRNHHSAQASHHHKHAHKPLALRRTTPTEDTWTRYTKNPLFIPIAVTIVAVIILVISGIWATVLYQSELKARKLRERIKVERSRRHISKDVSKITDPSVNIDVKK